MKNKIESAIISILIISTSIFDSENYIIIRFFSLSVLVILTIYTFISIQGNEKLINIGILILFILSFTLNYSLSVNKYNIRMYFAEYSGYVALLFIIAKMRNKGNLAETLPYALIISSLIQVIYSLPQILKGIPRINGNAGYANFMGFHLFLGILSAIYLIKKAINYGNAVKIMTPAIISVVLAFAAFRTGSRSVIILSPIILIFALYEVKRRFSIIIFTTIILLAVLIPNPPFKRLLNEGKNNPYGVQRLNIYKQSMKIAVKNPIIGIGRNNLPLYTLETNFPVEGGISRYGVHAEIAHNEYIEWIVGNGLFGVMMLLLIAIIFMRFLRSQLFGQNNKMYLIFIFLLYVFYSLIDNSLYLPYNAVVFFVLLGIMSAEDSCTLSVKSVNKIILNVFILISIVFVALDISVYFISQRLTSEPKKLNGDKENDIILYQQMLKTSYICASLSNDPKYFRYSFQISEKLFEKIGFVSDFYGALNALELFQINDRRNQNAYLDGARFIRKYKDTLLRKNTNLNEQIMGFYEKAISLSPFNPFYRSEYAEYLIQTNCFDEAVENLRKTVEYEPNYLKGYLLLSEIDSTRSFIYLEQYRIRKANILPIREKLYRIYDIELINEE